MGEPVPRRAGPAHWPLCRLLHWGHVQQPARGRREGPSVPKSEVFGSSQSQTSSSELPPAALCFRPRPPKPRPEGHSPWRRAEHSVGLHIPGRRSDANASPGQETSEMESALCPPPLIVNYSQPTSSLANYQKGGTERMSPFNVW